MLRCLVLVLLFLPMFAGLARAQEAETAAPFRVALTGKYPPFSFQGESGVEGFDVDISQEIADRLGRPLEVITTEWGGILPGLQSDRYDAIIGSMAITPERQKAVLFSRPYYVSGAQLFVRGEDADEIDSIDDLGGRPIGATLGSTYEQFLTANYPDADIRTFSGEPEIFQDMRTGRLGGFVTDRLVGMFNAAQAGEDFVPAGPLLYQERCAIPVRFENAELVEQINAALDAMEREGVLDELHQKWFGGVPGSDEKQEATDIAEQLGGDVGWGLILGRMLKGFGVTLFVAFVSIGIGFIAAIPIGAGIKGGAKPLRMTLIAFSDFIRGTPVLVQLFFVYYGLGMNEVTRLTPIQAGILTLTVNAAAYMGEVVRAGLISVPNGQTTGALALGLSRLEAFRHVVWPQAFRIMMPPLMNSVVALLKDTALISVITVPEVVTETGKLVAITFEPMKLWAIVGVMFFVVSFPLMKAAQKLEDRMRRKGYVVEG